MTNQVKRIIRRFLLRGFLLEKWVLKKDKSLDRAYSRALVRAGLAEVPQTQPPSFVHRDALRSILFIADFMWEQNELVPELAKVVPVTTIDVGEAVRRKKNGTSSSEAVAGCIDTFARSTNARSPDLILLYARSSLLSDQVFHTLRKHWSCPVFGMNLDDKVHFFPYGIYSTRDDNYLHWASMFDLNLTSSVTAADWYRQQGFPCLYFAMGFHSTPDARPLSVPTFKYGISFIGSRKREREVLVGKLLECGVPITLFGQGWPNAGWIDDPRQVYRQSQINLGMGFATSTGGISNLKARDFECPGAGACYLTTYNWELSMHYEIGKEILCYRTPEELLEIYFHYARRPEICLRIAQAAFRRCAAEHTWENRFRKVFREVGFKIQAKPDS